MPAGWTVSGACISGLTVLPRGETSRATGCATTTRTTSAEPSRRYGQNHAHSLASGDPTGGAADESRRPACAEPALDDRGRVAHQAAEPRGAVAHRVCRALPQRFAFHRRALPAPDALRARP